MATSDKSFISKHFKGASGDVSRLLAPANITNGRMQFPEDKLDTSPLSVFNPQPIGATPALTALHQQIFDLANNEKIENLPQDTRLFIAYLQGSEMSDLEKLKMISQYVQGCIKYDNPGVDDLPRSPGDILRSGKGDCEDYAAAIYAIAKMAGINTDNLGLSAGRVSFTFDSATGVEGHASLIYKDPQTGHFYLIDNNLREPLDLGSRYPTNKIDISGQSYIDEKGVEQKYPPKTYFAFVPDSIGSTDVPGPNPDGNVAGIVPAIPTSPMPK